MRNNKDEDETAKLFRLTAARILSFKMFAPKTAKCDWDALRAADPEGLARTQDAVQADRLYELYPMIVAVTTPALSPDSAVRPWQCAPSENRPAVQSRAAGWLLVLCCVLTGSCWSSRRTNCSRECPRLDYDALPL